jgi:hypothetical protein
MMASYFSYEIDHGVLFSLGSSHMFAFILPYLEIQMSSRLLWSSSGSRVMQVFLYANSSVLRIYSQWCTFFLFFLCSTLLCFVHC